MPMIGSEEHKVMSKMYAEMCAALNANVTDMLGWMTTRGSSVTLDWGEDNNQWECSWITGGNRFTGIRGDIANAIRDAIGQARTDYLMRFADDTPLEGYTGTLSR